MKKYLYITRHGQTLFNERRKIQGWCDSPLTELGKVQARVAKKMLQDIPFDHFYSSTSERACDTMELMIPSNSSYTRLKELKEMNFGIFEGESEDLNPNFEDYDEFFTKYGGENRMQVAGRMYAILREIMQKEDHQNVLVVSHAGSSLNFLSTFTSQEDLFKLFQEKGFTNCSTIIIEFENDTFKLIDILTPIIEE